MNALISKHYEIFI